MGVEEGGVAVVVDVVVGGGDGAEGDDGEAGGWFGIHCFFFVEGYEWT